MSLDVDVVSILRKAQGKAQGLDAVAAMAAEKAKAKHRLYLAFLNHGKYLTIATIRPLQNLEMRFKI